MPHKPSGAARRQWQCDERGDDEDHQGTPRGDRVLQDDNSAGTSDVTLRLSLPGAPKLGYSTTNQGRMDCWNGKDYTTLLNVYAKTSSAWCCRLHGEIKEK